MNNLKVDNNVKKSKGIFVLPSYDKVCTKRLNPNSSHRRRNKRTQYVEVLRYTCDGEYDSTIYINKESCEEYGYNYASVMGALNPKTKASISYKGFIWIRKRDFSEEELQKRVARRQATKTLQEVADAKKKKVIQIDVETKEVIKIYPSITSVEYEGYNIQSVFRVLDKTRFTYLDCLWEYYDESIDYSKEYVEGVLNRNKGRSKYRGRYIQEINVETGEVVDEFPSVLSCARESTVKVSESTIRKVLKGEKDSYKGYIWKAC